MDPSFWTVIGVDLDLITLMVEMDTHFYNKSIGASSLSESQKFKIMDEEQAGLGGVERS